MTSLFEKLFAKALTFKIEYYQLREVLNLFYRVLGYSVDDDVLIYDIINERYGNELIKNSNAYIIDLLKKNFEEKGYNYDYVLLGCLYQLFKKHTDFYEYSFFSVLDEVRTKGLYYEFFEYQDLIALYVRNTHNGGLEK